MAIFLTLLLPILLSRHVGGQLRVVAPNFLVQELQYNDTAGVFLNSRSLTAGLPSVPTTILGRVFYVEDKFHHCNEKYVAELEKLITDKDTVKRIFLVFSGQCSFLQKVQIAERNGADAVIILVTSKEEETLSCIGSSDRNGFVAVSEHGATVRIPSMVVTDDDGSKFMDVITSKMPLYFKLEWGSFVKEKVAVDLWVNFGSYRNISFLNTFSEHALQLLDKVDFRFHFRIFGIADDSTLCLDQGKQYCSDPLDFSESVQGSNTAKIQLQNVCMMRSYTKTPFFKEALWQFIPLFFSNCKSKKFTAQCALQQLKNMIDVDMEVIQTCMVHDKDAILNREKATIVNSATAIFVNGLSLQNENNSVALLVSICDSFEITPEYCAESLKSDSHPNTLPTDESYWLLLIVVGTLFVIIIGICAVCCLSHLRKRNWNNESSQQLLIDSQYSSPVSQFSN